VCHLLQCREGNFHELTETGVIEVITPDGELAKPGEAGELVITSLINDAMPMIRYRTGDIGVKTEGFCTCGRTSPILKEIVGRIADFIVTPDGRHVSHLNFVFEVTSNIIEAQLVQEKIDELTVNLIVHPDYNDNDKKLILAGLRSLLGEEMKITIQVVEEIQRTKEGKLKFVISKVPIQFSDKK
jgi:phenylacetate-CoA ligase